MKIELTAEERFDFFRQIVEKHGRLVDFDFRQGYRIYVFRDGYVLKVRSENGLFVAELEKPGFIKLLKESPLFRLALLYSSALVAVSVVSAGITAYFGFIGALMFSTGLIAVSMAVALKLYKALKRPFIRLGT